MYKGKYDKEEVENLYKTGKTYEEIAKVIGCTASNVGKILRKSESYKQDDTLTYAEWFAYEWFRATTAVKKGMGLA